MERDTNIEMKGLKAEENQNSSSITFPQSQKAPGKNVFEYK